MRLHLILLVTSLFGAIVGLWGGEVSQEAPEGKAARTSAQAQAPQRNAEDVGLRMSIRVLDPQKAGDAPAFRITFQNDGDNDSVLNLGMMLANGKVQMPTDIRLILTGAGGESRELHFSDKRYPGVAGRVDDFLVPLRSGSAYTIRLSLDDFWCPATKEFQLHLESGEYRVRALITSKPAAHPSGLWVTNLWTGKIESDTVTYRVAKPG